MDLLQEHQNFWAKVSSVHVTVVRSKNQAHPQIIYNTRGSNRSWAWLAMVTVSIFTLRDVIRQVQVSYKIPFNSTTHTSPSTNEDVSDIRDYLERQTLQSYTPNRKGNEWATSARDLLSAGAAYANTAGAFNNFRRDTRQAVNHGTMHGNTISIPSGDADMIVEDDADIDLGGDMGLDLDDLAMDEEEFPVGTEVADFVAMTREVIGELARYD